MERIQLVNVRYRDTRIISVEFNCFQFLLFFFYLVAMLSHMFAMFYKNNVIHGLTYTFASLNVLQFLIFFYFSVAIVKTKIKMLHLRVHFCGKKIIVLIIYYLEIIRSVEINLRGKILYTANRKYIYPNVNIKKTLLHWVSLNYLLYFGSNKLLFSFFLN